MMFGYGYNMGGWGWALTIAGMIAFWGLIITAGVLVFRHSRGTTRPGDQRSAGRTPEQILAERFARGDIQEPEYTQRLAVLRGQVAAQQPHPGVS